MSLEQSDPGLSWDVIADGLTAVFGLDAPPIAITFGAEAPPDVAPFDAPMPPPLPDGRTGRVSAGCVFWMEATRHTFSTVAADHGNCSVGSLTHGFVSVEQIVGNDDVATLLGSGWVEEAAVAAIPTMGRRPGSVTYGPLRDTPVDPDVVFLRLDGAGVMLLTDAVPGLSITDKPQCSIVATAAEDARIALSAGCALSRARTGLPDDEMTCAIPAPMAAELLERVKRAKEVNDRVVGYALDDARRFAPAPASDTSSRSGP